MISVKDKKADKESMKERFGGEGGPSFLYEDGRVKAVRKTLHRDRVQLQKRHKSAILCLDQTDPRCFP